LNDEAVVNSYGFRILTAGIDLTRFKLNPVMLDGHIQSNQNVIGSWKDITLEGGKLLAEPIFDMEDDNAKLIAGKVERGVIKGASMGIMVSKKDLANENGEMDLSLTITDDECRELVDRMIPETKYHRTITTTSQNRIDEIHVVSEIRTEDFPDEYVTIKPFVEYLDALGFYIDDELMYDYFQSKNMMEDAHV